MRANAYLKKKQKKIQTYVQIVNHTCNCRKTGEGVACEYKPLKRKNVSYI